MPFNKRTQKQVAERLQGNLDYYSRPGPLRSWRFAASFVTILLGASSVWAYYHFKAPEAFNNPGPISRGHAFIANDCAKCHPQGTAIKADPHQAGQIIRAAYFQPIDQACAACHTKHDFHVPNTVPDPTRPTHPVGMATEQSSCTSCHREHLTAGRMVSTGSESCADCHSRKDLMLASAERGRDFPARAFPTNVRPKGAENLLFFPKTRPPNGYTEAFTAFDKGHPPFQTEKATQKGEWDTLRFNHALHDQSKVLNDEKGNPRLSAMDPRLRALSDRRVVAAERGDRHVSETKEGGKLTCSYCHAPDPSGVGFGQITFKLNCAGCHDVRFDPNAPELIVPHEDPERVREFLRGLETRYKDVARKRNLNEAQANEFYQKSMQSLGARVQAGEDLEYQIFYWDKWVPAGTSGDLSRPNFGGSGPDISRYLAPNPNPPKRSFEAVKRDVLTRGALFPGCALCHQVTPAQAQTAPPVVARVKIPDRWFYQGSFPHSKHVTDGSNPQLTCVGCHGEQAVSNGRGIGNSRLTSDVNLPTQASCQKCHNSKTKADAEGPAGVANDCGSCHHYHNDPGAATAPQSATAAAGGQESSPLRAMLAGARR